jgi:hypothetical protein
MARINVEDDIESRLEYRKLLKLVGYDDDKALGMLIRFWRLAQKYWGEHKLVPIEEMENWDFQPLVESRWAIITEEGVYAKGAEEQFAWYRQKCDAAKNGGRPKKEKPAETEKKPEETETKPTRIEKNPPSPAPSLSPVPIQKEKEENITAIVSIAPASEIVPKKSKFSETTRAKMRTFFAAYSDAYKQKYNNTPEGIRSKALVGQIGHWIEHVAEVRAIDLVQVYLQISYRPFDENCHDLWQFLRHLNRIGNALNTGVDSNMTDWTKVFAGTG